MTARDAIDLWTWRLDPDPGALAVLSKPERARASRFAFPVHGARYVAARSGLRRVLATYRGVSAADICLAEGPHGKPALADETDLHFNLSHCEDVAFLAVTAAGEVGVDLEALRPFDSGGVERFFSPQERKTLAATPEAERTRAFYQCWTRKEAVLKALGDGLARPLDSFDVDPLSRDCPRVLRFEGEDPAAWRLWHAEPAPGFVGAVAMRAAGAHISKPRWLPYQL
ncbi:MAG TPA: 4'-phosphopantetheinyl transferase superfamily protein [Caulobacterales bacterium]|nr:4'-phosphopantetheinyl transferase superfamily protein [Caulobacterales bacterium]